MLKNLAHPSYHQGFARGPYESARPQDWYGLIGFWPMFLGPTRLAVVDLAGRGHNAALINMETSDWVLDGELGGYALELDGVDEALEIPHRTSLDVTGDYSIAATLIRLSDSGGFERIFSKSTDANPADTFDYDIFFQINDNDQIDMGMVQAGDALYFLTGTTTISENTPHQIVGVKNSTEFLIYLDGDLVDSGVTSGVNGDPRTTVRPFHIGRLGTDGVFFYGLNARIFQVSFYDYELPASLIRQQFQDPQGIVRLKRRRKYIAGMGGEYPLGEPQITTRHRVVSY